MRSVILQPAAENDLFEQWSYINDDNPAAANHFTRRAKETFQFLATMSSVGTAHTSTNPKLSSLRKFPVREFEQNIVFYLPRKKQIEIVRILHTKQDINSIV